MKEFFNHVQQCESNAGTVAIVAAVQDALALCDRLRERVGLPTPGSDLAITQRLGSMDEFQRVECCCVLLALARCLWDWDVQGETEDFDFVTSPPSLTKLLAHLPRSVREAAVQANELGSLVAEAGGSQRPPHIAAAMRFARNLAHDLCAVAKAERLLFVNTGDLPSLIERGWVEVFDGKPAWSRVVAEVDGVTLSGLAFEAA